MAAPVPASRRSAFWSWMKIMRALPPPLSAVVETAYRLFRAEPPRGALRVCHCRVCMDEGTMRELVATPLREISSQLLAEYTNSAHGWDEVVERELRYFLPRYLELIALDEAPDHIGLSVCLRRLADVPWRERWSTDEAALLDAFFIELLRFHLQQADVVCGPHGCWPTLEIDETLTLAVRAGAPLEPLFDAWRRERHPGACIHVAGLRRELKSDREGWRAASPFLDSHDEAACRIAEFAMDRSWRTRIEAAFFETQDPAQQQLLSDVLSLWP